MSEVDSLIAKRQRLNASANDNTGDSERDSSNDPYVCNDDGVWYFGRDRDGTPKASEWICSSLRVLAKSRPCDGLDWSYVLEFSDPMKSIRQWVMPARLLAGDGNELRAYLLAQGLSISSRTQPRARLTDYIQTRRIDTFWRHTDRIGWHDGGVFVLPDRTIGAGEDRILFQGEGTAPNAFRQRGTIDDWRNSIARLCVNNSRLVFSVSAAFAGVLLDPLGVDSGGFHWRGDSSSGKTTALRVAASVWGGADYMQRWRTTDNAIESLAAQHSDTLLTLDELAQVDPSKAGECAYTLANGSGKSRSKQSGALRARLQWRIIFLSAGEISLADRAAEANARVHTGQEIRMVDLAVDAQAGFGAFECLHEHADVGSAKFADALNDLCAKHYGCAGVAFIERLCSDRKATIARARTALEALAAEWTAKGASGQVARVARRFALVAVAGELATEFGLTGWSQYEATNAASALFHEWIEARCGTGTGERVRMLAQVRGFLASHGDSRFKEWSRITDDHAPNTLNRAGFRRLIDYRGDPAQADGGGVIAKDVRNSSDTEFYVFADVFRNEVCKGYDYKAVCRLLVELEHLIPGTNGRFDRRERLPTIGLTSCYRIRSTIFDEGEA